MSLEKNQTKEEGSEEALDEEFKLLKTRANTYEVKIGFTEITSGNASNPSNSKREMRHKNFLTCNIHHSINAKQWLKENENCENCLIFQPQRFPNGRLPTLHGVMNYYFHLKSVNKGSVENNVTLDLINHWVNCNVYTQSRKTIKQRLMVILKKYKYLREYSKNKKKDTYWNEYQKFIIACRNLFDIIGSQERRKKQENIWKVKMTEEDLQFYKNMCLVPQIGYSSRICT